MFQVTVVCNVDYQKILDFSKMVYQKNDDDVEELNNKIDACSIDRDLKIMRIKRDFKMLQKGGTEQVRCFLTMSSLFRIITTKLCNSK